MILQLVLCVPHSNADVERVFSLMNIIKSKLRNRTQSKLMNALLTIRSGLKREERTCDNYEIPLSVTQLVGSSLAYDEEESSGCGTLDCDFILPELV